ncbi:hypothetical protein NIES2101_41310 [Calothrix sp. HK-06]|nr:hypothetical protein NIES2101_41310 [Calothrix sp. HK-06]
MYKDFSGQNLRGRSFKGQNLEGADFSRADIRGANFTGANLIGANFSKAKAGLQKRSCVLLVVISWLLVGISGFFSAFVGALISLIFEIFDSTSITLENQIASWVSLIVIIALIAILIRQGINSTFAFAFTVVGAVAGAVAFAFTVYGAFAIARFRAGAEVEAFAFAFDKAFAFARAGAVVITVAVAFAIAFTGAFAIAFTEAVAVAGAIAGAFAIVITVAVAAAEAVAGEVASALKGSYIGTGAGAITGTFVFFLLSVYISRQAMKGSEKYVLICTTAIAFASFGGTSFRDTNLTNTNFNGAILKSTDFRGANLTRTCFQETKKLDRIRPGTSYLKESKVRQVILTGQGQELNFGRQDLRGVNFQGAYLQDASFIGADLSNANLQDADLSRAKLVQTQLDGTDFTGATLTGVYIEDWNVTSSTNFTGVRCEYVYMRLPTKDNPDPYRKPDNREETFGDGEFGDFIKPIFDTLDLYHSQGVDPRAIAVAFKQLAQNNPSAELEIVAIERRGDDKILLRAKTILTANKSELSQEYFLNYNQLKALAEKDFTALIAYQKAEIYRLENMINTALERPNFYSQGDIIMSEASKKQSHFNLQGAQFGGGLIDAETVNAEHIGGNITNYTTEQKQNLAQAAAEIQQLLTQLEQTNPTTTSAQKMAVVAQAVDQIEKNPTLKARVVGALKSGGAEALKEALDHPLVNVFIAAVEGWQGAD